MTTYTTMHNNTYTMGLVQKFNDKTDPLKATLVISFPQYHDTQTLLALLGECAL